jgi:hypothetical protein
MRERAELQSRLMDFLILESRVNSVESDEEVIERYAPTRNSFPHDLDEILLVRQVVSHFLCRMLFRHDRQS